jgi:hypothetical protein
LLVYLSRLSWVQVGLVLGMIAQTLTTHGFVSPGRRLVKHKMPMWLLDVETGLYDFTIFGPETCGTF